MEIKTALQILNEALNIAISKGCFGLVEVSNVVKSIEKINEELSHHIQPTENFEELN